MKLTKEHIKTYLIDVIGYRDYELKDYTLEELQGIVDIEGSADEFLDYSGAIDFVDSKGKEIIVRTKPITSNCLQAEIYKKGIK